MTGRLPRKVLIAVDTSDNAEKAFNYYVNSLHKIDSKVIVLYSPEASNVIMRMMRDEQAPYENWNKIWKEEEKKWMAVKEKYDSKIKEANILKGEFVVDPSNNPGEAIVEKAKKESVDFIVTGSRGLGKIRRTLVGSVSEYVIHHAHCTVCVCKA